MFISSIVILYFNYININTLTLEDVKGRTLSKIAEGPHQVNKRPEYAEKYPDVVNDPTPILDIAEDEKPQSTMDRHIYTIDGRMVNAKDRLPRGIYIINGRKVVVQ